MAKNISLLGADYPNVPSVVLPKTGGGTAEFTDVSDTTAEAADVMAGKVFYAADGTRSVGTLNIGEIIEGVNESDLEIPANSNKVLSSVSLSKGKWIVTAGHTMTDNINKILITYLRSGNSNINGASIRWDGNGSGGCNLAWILNVTDTSLSVGIRTYNTDSVAHTATNVAMRAIRIE